MSVVSPAPLAVAPDEAVAAGDEAGVLAAIRATGCALALWRRPLDPRLVELLAPLRADELDDIDVEIPLEDAPLHLAAALGASGYPHATAVALAGDMAGLARAHAEIGGWGSVRTRLDWVETDACRRFHADMLGTRLLTTYAGRGTQWRMAHEPDDAARELVTGEVAILKGRLMAPEAPVLHRSPPIAAEGGRRLLFVVDGPRPTRAQPG